MGKTKFKLFHGPNLELWKKWRCPGCGAHRTEKAGVRPIKEWEEDNRCPPCLAKEMQ